MSFMRSSAALAGLILLCACAGETPPPGVKVGKPYVVEGKTYYPEYDSTYDKIGDASWYGPGFHGKYTANGEVYNQNDLTAAHPTLPMPSLVRVTNLTNGKSLIVRINDRGPFKKNRIIDLSRASARELGIHSTSKVRVQFLPQETETYLANAQVGNAPTMTAINQQARQAAETAMAQSTEPAASQIVEATDATTHRGQVESEAAPVLSVRSDELTPASGETRPVFIREANASDIVSSDLPARPAAQPAAKEEKAADAPKAEEGKAVKILPNETIVEEQTPPPAKAAEKSPAKASPSKEKTAAVPQPAADGQFVIQAGSFAAKENAQKLASKISGMGKVNVENVQMGGKSWWRVRVGPFRDKTMADEVLDQVRGAGVPDARITHL